MVGCVNDVGCLVLKKDHADTRHFRALADDLVIGCPRQENAHVEA
jgi:hypothetical protein